VEALRQVESWPCANAAVALCYPDGSLATHGDAERPFAWASVSKLATAVAVLVAAEEGIVSLEQPGGPPGSTLRHLLAHASGLPFEGATPLAAPGTRRIYSNGGFELLAGAVERAAGMPFPAYFEAVWGFPLAGSAAYGVEAPLRDLVTVAGELCRPERVAAETLAEATSVQFRGLAGVLPGFGRFEPNDFGLGPELRDGKQPHWTGTANSPATFGHFGRSGTFLWVDPVACLALACLSDRDFGGWAKTAWPRLADDVLAEAGGRGRG
jgi:CubicO group peptidase (beta-lactamase class C family)